MEKLQRDIKYAFNLANERRALVASKDEKVELETRLGVYKGQEGTKYLLWSNAYAGVSAVALRKTYTDPYTQTIIDDGYNSYRKRGNRWEIKCTSATYDNFEVYTRVRVSIEAPSHPPSDIEEQLGVPKADPVIRNISRHSFTMNNSARVDFSIVYVSGGKSAPRKTLYEVEIEYTHTTKPVPQKGGSIRNKGTMTMGVTHEVQKEIVLSSLEEYIDTVQEVHRMMFRSPIIFTNSQLSAASMIANLKLSSAEAYKNLKVDNNIPYVNRQYFTEAKALDLNQLTLLSLFGRDGTGVIVSPKTDGEREFLVITEIGAFGVYPPSRAALYSTSEYTKSSKITIIDTEKYEGVLYHIDTLIVEGEDVRNRTFMARKAVYEEWASRMTEETIGVKLESKPTVSLTRDGFFNNLEKLINSWKTTLKYRTDGIMFTPDTTSYTDATGASSVIMKWKPEITIDLCVNNGKVWCVETTGTHKEFTGIKQASVEKVIMGAIRPAPGAIVEFKCVGRDLVAIKLRPEKLGPNTDKTSEDNWKKATINVITLDSLLCKTNDIMRKFHGRIKRGLFRKGSGVLLDIGSGRGGDLAKWGNYEMVLCVEPSESNIVELESRLANMEPHVRNKVKVLNARGQDSDKIHNFVRQNLKPLGRDKVDVVSMMDSLTFFFIDDKSLPALKRTIDRCLKDTGMFIWKAMDGAKVKLALSGSTEPVMFGKDYIQDRNGSLYVNISPNVEGVEGYVDISKLMTSLEMRGTVEHCLATNELMSDAYEALSSMYAYGTFTFNKAIVVPEGVTSILLRGKPHVAYLPLEKDYYPSCIEAIEAIFTSTPHSELISKYVEEALKPDPDYQTSGKDPAYTKFETANLGYLVELFYRNMSTEADIIASLDVSKDDQASLALASLLGIDVQIAYNKKIVATNFVKGSRHPSVYVFKSNKGYSLDRDTLESPMEETDSDPVFDLHDLLYRTVPEKLSIRRHINLYTPVLYRAAYVSGIEPDVRLWCVANHVYAIRGRPIPDDVQEEYGIDIEDDAKAIVEERIAAMDENR